METLAAVYGYGYGLWVWFFATYNPENTPLGWTGLDISGQVFLGQLFCVAGVLHGLGVHINGRKWWSPFLRLAGMFFHAGLFSWLLLHSTNPESTAVYNYGFLGVLLVMAGLNILGDCADALKRKRLWIN